MNWSRSLLKDNAKKVLSGSYWPLFLVTFVASLLGASVSYTLSVPSCFSSFSSSLIEMIAAIVEEPSLALVFFFTIAFSLSITLAYLIFLCAPVSVGLCRYTMETRAGFPPFTSLFSVFNNSKQYLNVAKVMGQMTVEIMLWTLLCFIPGIYKSYQLFYVPYLLAENPYLTYQRAKELSVAMTEGEKMEIFVLQLSFIGWLMLGVLTCCIGVYFVAPYISATMAELYAAARAKAFALGITDQNELADFTRYPGNRPL